MRMVSVVTWGWTLLMLVKFLVSVVTWGWTLLMRVKFLRMWFGFVGRGMNGECDEGMMRRREALKLEAEFSWLDLPDEVVELIAWRLRFEDEAKLACVCKSWRDIIRKSPATYPVGKSPLLLHVKSSGEGGGEWAIFHYHSPLLNKAFQLRCYLDLSGSEIISAKDGTLLIYNRDEMKMSIAGNISFNGTAIGVRNNGYMIFLIDTSREDRVTIHLRGGSRWVFNLRFASENGPFYMSSNPVYCDGRFYCLGDKGDRLGVFDALELTWKVHNVELKNKYDDDDDIHRHSSSCCYYLVDWIDTVMAVRVENYGSGIHLFVLDREEMVWEEIDYLGGRSLFLGSTLSVMSRPEAERLQNRVFLPHHHQDQDETKTVIVTKLAYIWETFYFHSRPRISSEEKNHAATTICFCNNSGEEAAAAYLGSIKNQQYSTIWYQPFYLGLTDE